MSDSCGCRFELQTEERAMKRYITKYLILIFTLVMILTPAFAAYADEAPAAGEGGAVSYDGPAGILDAFGTDEDSAGPALKLNGAPDDIGLSPAAGEEEQPQADPAVFTVRWMPQEETAEPLETDENIASGTAPSYDGEEPVKEADEEFTYEFAGWADKPGQEEGVSAEELPEVTGDAVYYAAFRPVPAESAQESAPETAGEDAEAADSSEADPDSEASESMAEAAAEETPAEEAPVVKETPKAPKSKAPSAPHVHSYGAWTVTVQPNYFRTGSRTRKCSCGQTQTETMPKLVAKNRWIGYGGKLYYFDGNGKVYKGWHKMVPIKSTREQWCYFNRNTGAFVKGIVNTTRNKWVEADGYRFYFYYAMRPIGAGWQVINGRLYYMDNWDAMVTGTFKAKDGKTYKANQDGTIWGMPYYIHKYKTFILIDKSDQTLYYYKDKQFNMAAGVVTGLKGVHDTPRGTYTLRSKMRNIYLTGPTWRSYVNYWMAFIGSSYGIHDATWRSTAEINNGRTYLYDGSHGCVNMTLAEASKLYYRVSIGTTVIVQE